jgi:hypothetical protein
MQSHTSSKNKPKSKAILAWLNEHADILNHLEQMMEVTGANGVGANSVDEFEQKMLNKLDHMGQDLLRDWAISKEAYFFERDIHSKELRNHSKKNC